MNQKVIGSNFYLVLYFKDFSTNQFVCLISKFFFQLKTFFPKDLPEQNSFNKKPLLKKEIQSKGTFFPFFVFFLKEMFFLILNKYLFFFFFFLTKRDVFFFKFQICFVLFLEFFFSLKIFQNPQLQNCRFQDHGHSSPRTSGNPP